jgi:hypothetical protein
VVFGNSARPASGKSSWTCPSPVITTSGPLTITARALNGSVVVAEHSVNVTIVVTDDVGPVVTITQPAVDGLPATETNGVFTVALQGSASDAMSGIQKVQFSVDGTNFTNIVTPAAPFPATLNWAATVTVPLNPTSPQSRPIVISAFDGKNNRTDTTRLVVTDTTAPTLDITEPPPQGPVTLPDNGKGGATLFRLAGVAVDEQSGVKSVGWALDPPSTNPQFKPAGLTPGSGKQVQWSVENIAIPGSTVHTLTVRCTDVAGKFTDKSISVSVAPEYPPKDPTVQEYFSSLIDFMVRRIQVKSQNRFLQVGDLTAEFSQPFQPLLSVGATLSTQPVHQLRIVIEVLRQYMTKQGLLTPKNPQQDPQGAAAQQALKQAEAAYRLAAYAMLLTRLGTSFEELRAARLADEQARQALAQRLGFDLKPPDDPNIPTTSLLPAMAVSEPSPPSTPEPERLQQLLLQPGQFSEADLEMLFGLVDTTRDPLQPRNVNPKVLDWQLQFLKASWAAQDAAAGVPIIDPDLIGEADLQPLSAAYFLWQSRSIWVNTQLAALKKLQESLGNDLLRRFDTVVGRILGPIADLLALDTQRVGGADIEPQLAQKQLTLAAFVRLMGLRKLAAAGTILLSEWDDVYSILVQVQKLRNAAQWRSEEQANKIAANNIVLGPDSFRLPKPGQAIVLPPVAPEWRINPKARQMWQDSLKARIDQQESLKQGLAAVVDATEEDTLPLLRDALVTAISKLQTTLKDANALSQKLQIDIQTSGYQKITRVHQAIQTLQDILIDLQMGALAIGWEQGSPVDFDEEMQWMGSYAAWQAAMQVFLYPENVLLPTLRPVPAQPFTSLEKVGQSLAFQQLLEELRTYSELTPEDARRCAKNYLVALSKNLVLPSDLSTSFQITEQCTQANLSALSQLNKKLIEDTTKTATSAAERLQNLPAYLREIFYFVPIALALQLQKSGQYLAALDWFRVVYAYDLPVDKRKIYYGLTLEHATMPDPKQVYQRPVFWLKNALNPHDIVNNSYDKATTARYDVFTRFVIMSLVRCLLDFADSEFTRDTNESLPRARSLYAQALDLLSIPELNPPAVPGLSPNPVIVSLKFHAEINLAKLRSGRNFAGLQRQLELTAPAGLASATRTFHPTPYRYSTLIERSKQLVTIAQQVEGSYLAALEKRDGEAYNLFKASQDLSLAMAGVQLQNLRVQEAAHGVDLADLQRQRATFQVNTYQGFLDAGMNKWEKALLNDYNLEAGAKIAATTLGGAVTAAQAMTTALSGGIFGSGAGGGLGSAVIVGALVGAQAAATNVANVAEANIQVHSLRNSVEQREREWKLQKSLAQKDVAISEQQIQLATDHQAVVDQESNIASLQQTNADATVQFLSNKFTNVELYDWMSGVLRQVYSYFLQQATAVARLARDQLAFERQDVAPAFIQHDYWQPTADNSGTTTDRRGLTGSARLLQDIYQLDQFAFETNKRKLQLTKTFSLARLLPLEFQRFRDTGVLTFATPMQIFDRDFPGHYLRLIKRVRTSVVALIPPNQGIRATLTTAGVSRVVISGDTFQTISVRRDPESVALTSPMNATGLFELDAQSDLILPFEFTGVDTMWNLEMPKAANPFDYRTIADVLFTIEYTALSSLDYRQQVIQQLDRSVSADRPYSFRNQFPDQWYDLHNPAQTATPMAAVFSTTREDFPPNLENLAIQHVAVYFVLADGETVNGLQATLSFIPQGSSTVVSGQATATPEGIISTRLGNAAGWMPMIGRAPFGQWQLTLSNTAEIRNLFDSEVIEDILFVITTSGRTPAWPV